MIKSIQAKKLNGEFSKYGKQAIEKNVYAVAILAGGQGSRLKINAPKGCVLVDKGDEKEEIFKIHIKKMKFTKVPLFIMVSRENESDTREYFQKNNYFEEFGYNEDLIVIFEQEEWPLLRMIDREKVRIDGEVKYGSSGHGGFYKAICKIKEKMDLFGTEYVYITNVDNILQRPLDYDFIGMSYKNGLDVTAIVATSDILAIGAIKGLYEVGVKVPDDISIIGFDDLEVSRYLIPGLTTIRQDISEKGEKAIQLLLNNIQDSEITKREIIIPVRIVARDSVKKNI